MQFLSFKDTNRGRVLIGIAIVVVGVSMAAKLETFAAESVADVQQDDEAGPVDVGPTTTRVVRKAVAVSKPKRVIKKPEMVVAQAPVSAPATPAPAAPKPATSATVHPVAAAADISGKLRESGAGTCAPQINAAAAGVMGSVARSNTVSSWAKTVFDKRLVSVSIGQKYANGTNVPYGATSIVAAPTPAGPCDTVAVQVVPSPLSCDHIREEMTVKSQIIGDLAGVLVLQDSSGLQTMLVPATTNTCVLVGIRTAYAN